MTRPEEIHEHRLPMSQVEIGSPSQKDEKNRTTSVARDSQGPSRTVDAQTSASTQASARTPVAHAEVLKIVGRKAHQHAARLTRGERAQILRQCATPWSGQIGGTLWFGGKFDTTGGTRCVDTWDDFGGMLTDYAQEVVDKGKGLWFTPALSSNGGCRDADAEAITQLTHDCDGAGDWIVLRDILDAASLAYIVQRSSSHKPELPKWHLHVPLTEPWKGTKSEWRAIYRHCVAWFSASAELPHDLYTHPATYGFDPSTDRMAQPWFPAARRSEADAPPETVCISGEALDLNAFLRETGFDPVLGEQEALAIMPARRARKQSDASVAPSGDVDLAAGLLKRAFRHAGWLGPEMDDGKSKVQCPWEGQHTTGSRFDSSTVLFPPGPGGEVGWLFCQHAHCRDRRPQEVLTALPVVALEAARAELRAEKLRKQTTRSANCGSLPGAGTELSRSMQTDMGNAERLIARHGKDILYCFSKHAWMFWDGKRWATDNIGTVIERAKDTVRSIYKEAEGCDDYEQGHALRQHGIRSEKVERIRAIEKLARSMVSVDPNQLDADPWLLNVDNGTIDLRSGQLRSHFREDRITKLVPIAYDPSTTCPLWEAFLARSFRQNKELIDFVQRMVGYSLTGLVSEQVLFFLYGTGANGKSTFLLTLQELLGDYATQAAPELLLTKKGESHPTDVADLVGRRVAVSTEVEAGRSLSEVLVKQLTGGDRIKARFMRQDFFEFKPTHKLLLAANHKPNVRGADHGIWRRIRLIPFLVTIPEAERDTGLDKKLQAELPGIMAWAVRGCLAWQNEGLGSPEEVKLATEAYREEMDALAGFFEDCCILNPGAEETAKALYDSYTRWCGTNSENPMKPRSFGMALRERGFKDRKSGTKLWCGLRLAE